MRRANGLEELLLHIILSPPQVNSKVSESGEGGEGAYLTMIPSFSSLLAVW